MFDLHNSLSMTFVVLVCREISYFSGTGRRQIMLDVHTTQTMTELTAFHVERNPCLEVLKT